MLRHVAAVFALGSILFLACKDEEPHPPAAGEPTGTSSSGSVGSSGSGKDGGTSGNASSSSTGGPVTLPPAPTDPAGFCKAYLDASLTGVSACCTAEDLDSPGVKFLKGFQALALPQCTDRLTKSLADGKITYQPDKASSCLGSATVTKAQCPATGPGKSAPSADCDAVYAGKVAEGGTCAGDIECADGLPCQGTVCKKAATTKGAACAFPDGQADPGIFGDRERCIAGETCFGGSDICAPIAKLGEKCFFDTDCDKGLQCGGSGPDKKCETIVKQAVGGPCDSDSKCNDGLSCQTGKCATRKAAGESCTETIANGTECKGYCDGATDSAPGKCHTFCGSN